MNDDASLIEQRKDTLNLRPALDFVRRHLDRYETNFLQFISGQISEMFIFRYVNCGNLDGEPQVSPAEIDEILQNIPATFQILSQFTGVDYSHNRIVPVPIFEQDGSWHNVDFVSVSEFPRQHDHPSRILIGRSDGYTIFPSALPESISSCKRSRWFYQLHVFLHEFFHTIEFSRREKGLKEKIILESPDGERFTLQQWWQHWADTFRSAEKIRFATRYAATYAKDLDLASHKNPDLFTRALAEQICESFVGYILGIVPNDEDIPDFKEHSPVAWRLMSDLAKAKVIRP